MRGVLDWGGGKRSNLDSVSRHGIELGSCFLSLHQFPVFQNGDGNILQWLRPVSKDDYS